METDGILLLYYVLDLFATAPPPVRSSFPSYFTGLLHNQTFFFHFGLDLNETLTLVVCSDWMDCPSGPMFPAV